MVPTIIPVSAWVVSVLVDVVVELLGIVSWRRKPGFDSVIELIAVIF